MKTYQIANARYYVNGILDGYEYQSSATLTYHIPNYQTVQLLFAAKEKNKEQALFFAEMLFSDAGMTHNVRELLSFSLLHSRVTHTVLSTRSHTTSPQFVSQ